MLFFHLIFAFAVNLQSSNAATCDTVATVGSTWPNGQDGTLNFAVPVTTSSWTVVMTFDKALTSLSAWTGIVSGCTSGGNVCTFSNQVKVAANPFELSHYKSCTWL